jgi:hypothetical protein
LLAGAFKLNTPFLAERESGMVRLVHCLAAPAVANIAKVNGKSNMIERFMVSRTYPAL